MRVNIYAVDYDNEEKGELVGTVRYVNGKIHIDAEDKRVENIIHKKVLNGKVKIRKRVPTIYYISTPDFVQLLGIECWKNGYVTEIAG